MQAIVETLFDAAYLIFVVAIGITMIVKSKGEKEYRLFGIMAVVLGAGDAFHLVPRALALCTTGLENFTVPLGMGKFITSITMTIFYIILYYGGSYTRSRGGMALLLSYICCLSCGSHFVSSRRMHG